MIAKVLGAAVNLVVCICAATMIAEVITLCYFWSSWNMDRGRLVQILAIAQGLDLLEPEAEANPLRGDPAPEQPTFDQVIAARASADRDLRMREMSLASAAEELKSQQRRLAEQRDAYERLKNGFQAELARLKQGAEAEGRSAFSATMERLEPEQAKTFLLEMLEKNEIEEVVILLAGMEERRRSALLGEFQAPDEIAKIAEVLRLIRQGHPQAALAEEVSQKVSPEKVSAR